MAPELVTVHHDTTQLKQKQHNDDDILPHQHRHPHLTEACEDRHHEVSDTDPSIHYAKHDPYPSMAPSALRKLLLPVEPCAPVVLGSEDLDTIESCLQNLKSPQSLDRSYLSSGEEDSNDSSLLEALSPLSLSESEIKSVTTTPAHVNAALLEQRGDAATALRRKLIHGTNALIVQGGSECKLPIYERLHALGVNVYILDVPSSYWAGAGRGNGAVKQFLPFASLFEEDALTVENLAEVLPANVTFHAVLTYYEDATVQAARIAELLGTPGPDLVACRNARSKYCTRQQMQAHDLPVPKFARLHGPDDLQQAMADVGFPAVMKPCFGAASIGVVKVHDRAEAKRVYAQLTDQIEHEDDPLWMQGKEILFEEYYDGDEFDVDVVLSGGRVVFAKVSDNWNVSEPYFQETGMHAPSLYPVAKQDELIAIAVKASLALEFSSGCLHVECRYTSKGEARIIEVNGRMGGDPIYDFNKLVWGVDLVELHYLAMLNIPLHIDPRTLVTPHCAVAEFVFNAPCSGVMSNNGWLDFLADHPQVYKIFYFKHKGDRVTGPEDGVPDWLAEIIVIGHNGQRHLNDFVRSIVTEQAPVPITPNDSSGPGDGNKLEFFFPDNWYPFVPSN